MPAPDRSRRRDDPRRPAAPRRRQSGAASRAPAAEAAPGGRSASAAAATRRRRRARETAATDELRRLAGSRADRAVRTLVDAAEAYSAGRERDALRMLRPLLDAYPDAAGVRELAGLCHYRIGNYRAAARELEAFVELTGSTEQHPVLMDCCRAIGQSRRVDELWHALTAASPSAALVTEGRIVMAGNLADRGRRDEAIALLEKRAAPARGRKPADHQLRLWYALADLQERAGNVPRARTLFRDVAKVDPSFADVAERLATLG